MIRMLIIDYYYCLVGEGINGFNVWMKINSLVRLIQLNINTS